VKLEELFDEHGALSFEKQLRLADLVGESNWRFDMDAGLLSFDTFNSSVQLLGTVSEYSQTWLWAWANAESNIPGRLLRSSEELRAAGRRLNVAELIEAEFSVDAFQNGHRIAMVAVGILGATAYYRGPYEGGALFMLIPELPIGSRDARQTNLQVTSDFTSFISAHECHHRTAFESYLRQKGYRFQTLSARRVVANYPHEPPIDAVFDSEGRLAKFETEITAPGEKPRKPWWKIW